MQMQIIIDKFLRSEKSKSLKLCIKQRHLLYVLSSFMGNKSYCWPSISTLMYECGLSKSSIIRSLKNLETSGLLIINKKKEQNNIYSFTDLVVSHRHHLVSHRHQEVVSHRHPNNININNINNNINNNVDDFSNELIGEKMFWEH